MKDLDMMIIEAWAHYFGVAPPNLCVNILDLPYFLFSGKSVNRIWKVRVIPTRISEIQSIGESDRQEAFIRRPNKYPLSHLLKRIT